ncbi:MAG: Phosphonate ABC transporter ATP-binding protein [uncultured Microvirga sp.]|uniref:Phosphonate ABC transporter ATP-binding protein n=1 Tax=uncultured Microvirga sp. TaxID=412392 RepID=A0A6J4KG33_9HYPH|nr:MAG: Phosphonate ABC transporter ATP-binding protein [uncultured Microvirga sp.]
MTSTAGEIRVAGLTKSFARTRVLDDVSLAVGPGEIVALVGASGVGKTTLFRCLAGLLEPEAGEMWVAGHPMHRLRGRGLAEARRDIGFVFQQFNLVRRLSALDNAVAGRLASAPLWRVVARRFSNEDRSSACAALRRVGLSAHIHQRADQLSGGQQQRVAIARALVQRSRVLLADEPVASLDPETAASVLALLRDIARENGLTVLCSLHQPDLARGYADRVITLRSVDTA